ncbi:MAG: flagellar biosynthesis anti-sigma factor FlgM [Planctomycetes bacterium]|nr:flagellar biosynthesis anti-sigma factor FlgM [Planctomycetota bacterium]MCH9724636.1 flagellar biosynthesis anti-sigma factor FlgM [Planctomycetota bacterium]MCH9777925.1 flagellar biosynthesis anti-sigma factor FlgM [Planctomycetota bacterium]MCH9793243.1 flagellar biosynthesis anti-sigma factor FlgM [Planctomycetota bacterium]MDF1742570.1 flagellar biosynthesis anti-sigma factor FlgM [Gimesia sp.]
MTADYQLNRSPHLRYHDPHTVNNGQEDSPPADSGSRDRGNAAMDVNGTSSISGSLPINKQMNPIHTNNKEAPTSKPISSPQDELEISSAGRMLDEMTNNPEMRAERLAQIKAAIDDGTYETDEKLNAALNRLLNQIDDSE